MGTLDLIRNWTPERDNGRTDFDDLPAVMPTGRKVKEMVRIVKGATDLQRPDMPRSSSTGTASTTPATEGRTPRQAELMVSLIGQIRELDTDLADQAEAYTDNMTAHDKWTPGREGNASAWIGRMITKVRALRDGNRNRPAVYPAGDLHAGVTVDYPVKKFDAYDDIPSGYYAIHDDSDERDDVIKFYRIKHRQGSLYVDAMASDERHPVRVWATRKVILDTIREMGWAASTALYGSKIGKCGRCHRTLTDADSRARGIGPDCWGKM